MRARDGLFLLAAVLLHAGGFAATRGLASRAVDEHAWLDDEEREKTRALTEAEFDVLLDEPTARNEQRLDPPEALAGIQIPERGPSAVAPRGRALTPSEAPSKAPPEAPPEQGPSSGPAAPAASDGSAKDTFDALPADPRASAPPGLDGVPVWALPGVLTAPSQAGRVAPVPPVTPARPLVPVPAASAVSKRGLSSGSTFPTAGTLASAVAQEVQSSVTPEVSESLFELSLDAKGNLVSVRFLSATGGSNDEWRRIAKVVQQRFAGRALPMTGDFTRGSRITVTVSSKVVMPDGTAHAIPKPKWVNSGGKPIIREESFDDRHRGSPRSEAPPPIFSLEFEFDLANIGAKRRRVVSTQVHAVPVAMP